MSYNESTQPICVPEVFSKLCHLEAKTHLKVRSKLELDLLNFTTRTSRVKILVERILLPYFKINVSEPDIGLELK